MENMDQVLDAPSTGERKLQYAGFWIRVGAYIIDGILLWIVNFVIQLALMDSPILAAGISLMIGVVYFGFLESSESQATFGKRAVGIKVGDRNGNRISLGNAIGRYLGKIISALFLGIGFMMVGWDEKNQGLHDKMADTYVFYA